MLEKKTRKTKTQSNREPECHSVTVSHTRHEVSANPVGVTKIKKDSFKVNEKGQKHMFHIHFSATFLHINTKKKKKHEKEKKVFIIKL